MNDGYLSCESDSEYCLGEIRYFFDYYGGQLKLKANGTSTKAWCCTEFYDKSEGVTKKAGTSADGTSLTDFDIANAASYKYVEFSKPITATIKNVDNPPAVNFKAGDKITLTATEMATLGSGEAYLWANKATDKAITQRPIKISIRPRVTKHGGDTIQAVK